jgi:peptidoglycan-associated lipoprotein
MKKLIFTLFAISALLFVATGCRSTDVAEDTSNPISEGALPGALADGEAGGFSSAGGDGYGADARSGKWVDPNALSANGADADGWVPADPGNNLGMPVIYFAYDSDVLVPSETANLDKIAAYLNQNQRLGLVIEGHCDSRGTDEYNRALGERRANAIRAYLANRGVADNRMKTQSFGKDKPAVAGSGERVWRQNRRGVPVPMHMPR